MKLILTGKLGSIGYNLMEFYYIIQGRVSSEFKYKGWQHIYKNKIEAKNKKEARKLISEMFFEENPGKRNPKNLIPMLYNNKNKQIIDKNSLLLHIYPLDSSHYINNYFKNVECKQCKASYTAIDKFNLDGSFGKYGFCSQTCENDFIKDHVITGDDFLSSVPVIYKITEKPTNKVYIGKTSRSFTLRWWEHIKGNGGAKSLKQRFDETPITDWVFEVIEVLEIKSTQKYILERESYWIKYYNSIENGFNTIISNKDGILLSEDDVF